ncbi:MAG: hypothetical protein D8M53_07415 [Armatimonadetes bacterium]|nr:MAG: hypothetical protein EDM73_09045 [Armatimonadota bacterium]MBC6969072.1 hypothetical protein [Armatimonadota bacterium]MBL1150014.1 hypothetical protein [Armatimonadota bacterium]MCE7900485.1 hypothetical protein [Armatimonadetes bacterium ATM1]RIJ94945.1 MAG: hypothetical protein DCC45_11485 [Armatimonadota bacterium]
MALRTEGGELCDAQDVIQSADGLFFTCCCEPCKVVARSLPARERAMPLVSYRDLGPVKTFVREVGWTGPVYLDPGSAVQLAAGITSCPKFLLRTGNSYLPADVDQVLTRNQ